MLRGKGRESGQSDKGWGYVFIGWLGKDFENVTIGRRSEGDEGNNHVAI